MDTEAREAKKGGVCVRVRNECVPTPAHLHCVERVLHVSAVQLFAKGMNVPAFVRLG